MSTQKEPFGIQYVEEARQNGNTSTAEATKKQFVEPELSVPVDVLEATTFFQSSDSGVVTPESN